MPASHFSRQVPFEEAGFAENPEPRCPVVLLLDTSASMIGEPIRELNSGLAVLKNDLLTDSLAVKRVELAIVTFGPVCVQNEFHTISNFYPPTLSASGDTPMGTAIEQGLLFLEERKAEYRANGVSFFRPWVLLLTDGAPTDKWQHASQLVRNGEEAKKFIFYAVGVQTANMDILARISVRAPLRLQGLKFRELFQWLSTSLKSVSQSVPGVEVSYEQPRGWIQE
jgi:uncharacterized protein YegL